MMFCLPSSHLCVSHLIERVFQEAHGFNMYIFFIEMLDSVGNICLVKEFIFISSYEL